MTEELTALAFYSSLVTVEEKEAMVSVMLSKEPKKCSKRFGNRYG